MRMGSIGTSLEVSTVSSKAIFAMLTFKPLGESDYGEQFFQILADKGAGILDPQFVNGRRFDPASLGKTTRLWRAGTAIRLDRTLPSKVSAFMTIADESIRRLVPSNLFVSIDKSYLARSSRLFDIVNIGDAIYSLLSACYGALFLDWTPIRGALADIDRYGLPGLGWVTWLGPEYGGIVHLSTRAEFEVTKLPDGGTRITLPLPERIDDPEPNDIKAYDLLVDEVGSDALQLSQGPIRSKSLLEALDDSSERKRSEKQRSAKLPKFRFVHD